MGGHTLRREGGRGGGVSGGELKSCMGMWHCAPVQGFLQVTQHSITIVCKRLMNTSSRVTYLASHLPAPPLSAPAAARATHFPVPGRNVYVARWRLRTPAYILEPAVRLLSLVAWCACCECLVRSGGMHLDQKVVAQPKFLERCCAGHACNIRSRQFHTKLIKQMIPVFRAHALGTLRRAHSSSRFIAATCSLLLPAPVCRLQPLISRKPISAMSRSLPVRHFAIKTQMSEPAFHSVADRSIQRFIDLFDWSASCALFCALS